MSPKIVVTAAALVAVVIAGCGSSSGGSGSSGGSATAAAGAGYGGYGAPAKKSKPAAAPASGALDSTGGDAAVTASDFAFSTKAISAKAGPLKVTLKNTGAAPHQFVVVKTSAAPDALEVTDGRASEAGSVGEIEAVKPGASGTHTFDLEPGRYVFFCNMPGHYAMGMRGSLTVT